MRKVWAMQKIYKININKMRDIFKEHLSWKTFWDLLSKEKKRIVTKGTKLNI